MRFVGVAIKDLKLGETINGIYILRKKELKEASNKKPFIDVVFSDNTGEIPAKIWDAGEDVYSKLQLNMLYYVNAKVDCFKDMMQLTINKMRIADPEDQKEIDKFVPSAPIPAGDMLNEIYEYAYRITNEEIRKLVLKLLKDKEEKLVYYPAAKSLHHSIRSGLLYHILRMLRLSEKLKEIYEEINLDLLYAGVLIHDLAKIGELEANELGISEYSKEGQLLGHIVMGICEIERAGNELGISPEVMLLLKHMVLSHHYEAEYGSPKRPMFLEAELLHFIDMIDARVYDYVNNLKNVEEGGFSDPVWSLDRRRLYKPQLHKE
ncbi:3'-5' exonuclease [Thermoclostridium stercorarium subsp. thermolacticum DSM 2910]|uniref:3'-5' exonuclease n=1 Tax=Thermoclostridium stercorarium subsp. thermolacticum DSM 2910 TaxID=1121336 RepID=A0A1B1YDI2_THEST|nr:HD domain-containing protein [Thermoclostridium stercorarium]ANW98815.1 3'-5' exonuclease [Thermoclostridium stercorarium subsp. thermolacticum DSM 2910]UZQ84444.1 HD domain-containing protein [Thermoclostridium stercorarium]